MAYRRGDPIAAADYNGFLTQLSNVLGTGSGDSGYGQTVTQAEVSPGDPIASAEWVELRAMAALAATHQGSTVDLPTTGVLAVGEPITAHDPDPPSSNLYDLPGSIVTVVDNRLSTANAGAFTLTTSAHQDVRSTTWSSTITTVVDVTFPSQNAARFFFNSGGRIRLALTHPTGSVGTKDYFWSQSLQERVGTLVFGATSSSRSATDPRGTLSSGLGFYSLTDDDQLLYDGTDAMNDGDGSYGYSYGYGYGGASQNDCIIVARRLSYTADGVGGNGLGVRFSITIADETTAGTDIVSAGTTATFGYWRATTYLTGINTPTFTTTVNNFDI